MPKYLIAIDQGTTSSRAIIFDKQGGVIQMAQKEFTQIFRSPAGWNTTRWKSGQASLGF